MSCKKSFKGSGERIFFNFFHQLLIGGANVLLAELENLGL
jgi:hypothetical protein